jgi:hypothetical protein
MTTYLKIESIKRNSGTASDFKIQLSRQIEQGDTYELTYAHIPETYFQVDSTNNQFYFNEGSTDILATIPSGYYTNATLAAALSAAVNAVSAHFYTVALSAVTQKITITDGSGSFTVKMGTERSAPCVALGFTTDTALAATQTGESNVNLEKNQSLSVDVNEVINVQGTNFGSTFDIPSEVDSLQVAAYRSDSRFVQTVTFNHPTTQLRVRLKDAQNVTIDLQGHEWFMLLKRI